ncbi:MAG: hypothetical protein J7L14_00960 [Candidatus Diapherotrites archaeon]|nr:hypothetical protein [Candidatus Diapherotrites archaeon]
MDKRILAIICFVILFSLAALMIFIPWPAEQHYAEEPPAENKLPQDQGKLQVEAQNRYQRQRIDFIKFVSSENCLYLLDEKETEELRKLNVNGIRICPLYSKDEFGNIREDIPESVVVALIERAHNAGFAVFLEINAGGKPTESNEPESRYSSPEEIESLYKLALHWAKIAEEEKVEFFSPLNEPNLMFTNTELFNKWVSKSQELKKFFNGFLVLKLADLGPEKIPAITNYDYLAFDIMWSDSFYRELMEHIKRAVKKGNELKNEYNLKGFFFGELGAERSKVDKDVQAEIFRIVFEETWQNVDGYCFLGWSDLEFKFKDNEKAKEIIREWYAKQK